MSSWQEALAIALGVAIWWLLVECARHLSAIRMRQDEFYDDVCALLSKIPKRPGGP